MSNVEFFIDRAKAAHDREVDALYLALFCLAEGPGLIAKHKDGEATVDEYAADMTEGIRLANLIASQFEPRSLGMKEAVEILRNYLANDGDDGGGDP